MNSSTHLISGSMKLIHSILGVLLISFGSSCSTYQPGIVTEPDDRYYSLRDAKKEQRAARKLSTSRSSAFADTDNLNNQNVPNDNDNYQRITDPNDYSSNDGTTIINNYNGGGFDMDNYYDYMYASRIRRFHRNTASFGYYDPFFTNTYFYNPNPFLFGNSIYSSYGFFNPYVPWGFNNWGGGPGLNIGWNSFTGFNIGFNMGWGNPYMGFNNPWRWNSWGYSPWGSPFGFNPWVNNHPWGFNSWNNGYMMGYSNALMQNSMGNNGLYYNSFDNNTYNYNTNNIVNNYGVNSSGAGGGSSYKTSNNLSNTFSKEIGQTVSAMHADNDTKISQGTNSQNQVKGGNTSISPVNAADSKNTQIQPATTTNGKGQNATPQISSPTTSNSKGEGAAQIQNNNAVKGNGSTQIANPSNSDSNVNQVKGQNGTTQSQTISSNPTIVKGNNSNQAPNSVITNANVNNQTGKQDLINQGKTNNVANNYSSTPVKGSQAVRENSPVVNRPANIDPKQFDNAVNPSSPSNVTNNNSVRGSDNPGKAQPYTPNYDYNNGVRSNNLNNGSSSSYNKGGNSSQPSRSTAPAQNYQKFEAPKQAAPAQNNQRFESPKQATPDQNYQRYVAPKQSAPAQNYQRYQAPKQSAPAQNYQRYEAPKQTAPAQNNQRYVAPRQNTPSRQYQAPSQSAPSRQYQAPAPKSPRNSYQTPSNSSSPSRYSAPARSNSNRSFSAPSRPSSSPSMRSSGGSNMNSSGGKTSSPRRK